MTGWVILADSISFLKCEASGIVPKGMLGGCAHSHSGMTVVLAGLSLVTPLPLPYLYKLVSSIMIVYCFQQYSGAYTAQGTKLIKFSSFKGIVLWGQLWKFCNWYWPEVDFSHLLHSAPPVSGKLASLRVICLSPSHYLWLNIRAIAVCSLRCFALNERTKNNLLVMQLSPLLKHLKIRKITVQMIKMHI